MMLDQEYGKLCDKKINIQSVLQPISQAPKNKSMKLPFFPIEQQST